MLLELKDSDKVALTKGKRSLSYRNLNQESDRLAKIFFTKLEPQIIVLQSESSPEFVIQLFAIWKARKIACIVNKQYSQAIKQHCLTSLPCYALVESEKLSVSKTKIGTAHLPDQAALILFTSGSSNYPKAVVLSWENIHANVKAVQESLDFGEVESQDLSLSLSYSFGLCGQLLPALASNVETYLCDDMSGVIRNANLPRNKLMLSGIPEQLSFLAKVFKRFRSARSQISHVVAAGAPLSVTCRHELIETFSQATIFTNYGMTECSPRVLSLSSRQPQFLAGGSGFPVPGIRTRISPEGELIILGKQVMLGYLEGQRLSFPWAASGSQRLVHSGDQVRIENGLHYVLGRKDAQIKVSGVKINCQQIDQVYERHPDLQKACSMPISCDTYGQRLVVFAKSNLENCEADLILNELRPQLLHQAAVKQLVLLKKWPLTPHGKTDRRFLRKLIEENVL